jgi:Protein of unknown function (DUF4232)
MGTFGVRRWVAAAALAAPGLVAAGAAPATGAIPACATSGLVVWLDGGAGVAAGSAYYPLTFTNLSGRACTLAGYPGVSAVGLAGGQLGRAAARDRTARARTVVLAAGRSATAMLQIATAENFPRATCRPVTAAGLRVYPPGQTAARLVPFPFSACSRRGPVDLFVRAVRLS